MKIRNIEIILDDMNFLEFCVFMGYSSKERLRILRRKAKKMDEKKAEPLRLADVIDDMIEATRNMDMVKYRNFMELPLKERIEAMNTILGKKHTGK